MAELTKEEALKSASDWTRDEIDYIYERGGHIIGDVKDSADESTRKASGASDKATDEVWNYDSDQLSLADAALTLAKDTTAAWTDEEIDYIYSHGGYIYDAAGNAIDYETAKGEEAEEEAKNTVWDWVTGTYETVTNTINNVSLVLGAGFDAAMYTLCHLPELIFGLKDDLAGFFTFDPVEYQATVDKLSARVPRPEVVK